MQEAKKNPRLHESVSVCPQVLEGVYQAIRCVSQSSAIPTAAAHPEFA